MPGSKGTESNSAAEMTSTGREIFEDRKSGVQLIMEAETKALLEKFNQFRDLIDKSGPSTETNSGKKDAGSAHPGEDGRFVEDLIRTLLRRFLPRDIEVLSGFVLKPKERRHTYWTFEEWETQKHSGQIDLLVCETSRFPSFLRMGETAIVPPEAVIAAISIKKTLRGRDIKKEALALAKVGALAVSFDAEGNRKHVQPFLGLIGVESKIPSSAQSRQQYVFEKLGDAYGSPAAREHLANLVASFDGWSVIGGVPQKAIGSADEFTRYHYFEHDQDISWTLQLLIGRILHVYYERLGQLEHRPGFTDYPDFPEDSERSERFNLQEVVPGISPEFPTSSDEEPLEEEESDES